MPKKGSRSKAALSESKNGPFDEVSRNFAQPDATELVQAQQVPSAPQMDSHDPTGTPIRHRNRSSAAENRWDSALAHQYQTPERHRSDLASLVLSPPTNHFGSPGLGLASPNLVPLFQPSPKRQLLSPQQHSGVNSFGNIFQSPVRPGDFQGSEFLRFETPSSKARYGGLLSPSPLRSKRHPSSGQHRKRAVSLEARGWQLGGLQGESAGGLEDVQHLMHGPEDEQEDLIKDILQSPGPKEIQQLTDRPNTRSRSLLASAPAAVTPPHRLRRRALDFSKADTVHHDFHALPGKRLTRHNGVLAAATTGAVEAADTQQRSSAQPQLPLLPLDLSECEKHNPAGSPFKQPNSTGVTPRRSRRHQQQQQQQPLEMVLTSPRSTLDAAMAHITHGALPDLLQSSSLDELQGLDFNPESANALKSLQKGLVRPVFEVLSKEGAAAAATGGSTGTAGGVSTMVPLVDSTEALGGAGMPLGQQTSQLHQQHAFEQYQQEQADVHAESTRQQRQSRLQQQQHLQDEEQDSDDPDYDEKQSMEATERRGRRWNLRPHGKKQYGSSYVEQPQPSRRSRRIAGDSPEEDDQQQERNSEPGSSGRSRRHRSRIAALQQEEEVGEQTAAGHLEQQVISTSSADNADSAEDAVQRATTASADEPAAAGYDKQEAEENNEPCSRSKKGNTARAGRKGSKTDGRISKVAAEDSGLETEAAAEYDADAVAAALAAAQQLYGLPGVSGLQQLLQSGGLLQLPNGITVPIGMTPSKGGVGLLGPNTPDDVRMAHMAQPYGMPVRSCHCKKSQCLKLYCDCFANNVFCNGCSCTDCRNVESNHAEVLSRRNQIQQRDPTAFHAKLAATDADTLANRKGCKCKKSHCLKKYCECFQMGVRCAELCKCTDCRNVDDGSGSLNKKLLPRTLHAAASAAQQCNAARLQHPQQFWPIASGLGVAAAAVGATPAGSAAMGLGPVLLRMPGGPNTPSNSQLVCMPLQSPADAAAAAAVAQLQASSAQAAAAADNMSRIAKPLLPQFLQAAAATNNDGSLPAERGAGEAAKQNTSSEAAQDATAAKAAPHVAAEAACLLSDEELPTPDQQAALEHGAALTALQPHHHQLTSPTNSSGGHSSRGVSPARVLSLDRASYEGSVLRSNSLSSPIPALQAMYGAPVVSPVVAARQQSPAAAGSTSAVGPGSPRLATGISSVSSKARHRLASTSRAVDDEPRLHKHLQQQHQQQTQQQGIMALVGPGNPATMATSQQQQMGVTTRRQLLQNVKAEPDAAGSSAWARPPGQTLQPQPFFAATSHWQRDPPAAVMPAETPEKKQAPVAAADVDGGVDPVTGVQKGSPQQEISLGPNGPTVLLSQRALNDAMSQSMAALGAAGGGAATAGDDSSTATVGMLMTVVDEQGQVQYYFLPGTQAATTAAAGAVAVPAPTNTTAAQPQHVQQQEEEIPMDVDDEDSKENVAEQELPPLSHYQLRRRTVNPMQGTGLSQLPQDVVIDQRTQTPKKQQPPTASAETTSTPSKQQQASAISEQLLSPGSTRCLRSSSHAKNCNSNARTPAKRSTPVKRKAGTDEDQDTAAVAGSSPYKLQPSPAKLLHQLASPGQQQQHNNKQQQHEDQEHSSPPQQQYQPTRQVLLSPVKRTKDGGLVVMPPQQQQEQQQSTPQIGSQEANNSTAAAYTSPFQLVAENAAVAPKQEHLQQQQHEVMQLFIARTAEGQQYLLQAPVGTDPAKLLQSDCSVEGAQCLGALNTAATSMGLVPNHQQQGSSTALAAEMLQQYGVPGNILSPTSYQRQQQLLSSFDMHRQMSVMSGSFSGELLATAAVAEKGHAQAAPSSPQPRVLLSPRDGRTRDRSMFKFSPGCTTVFSPTKPSLGNSPGRSGFQ